MAMLPEQLLGVRLALRGGRINLNFVMHNTPEYDLYLRRDFGWLRTARCTRRMNENTNGSGQ